MMGTSTKKVRIINMNKLLPSMKRCASATVMAINTNDQIVNNTVTKFENNNQLDCKASGANNFSPINTMSSAQMTTLEATGMSETPSAINSS